MNTRLPGWLSLGGLLLIGFQLVAYAQTDDILLSRTAQTLTLDAFVRVNVIDAALCEPSAALRAPWDAHTVLVADNEAHKQLYLFQVGTTAMRFAGALTMPGKGKQRPRDIEALAAVGQSLLVVGSHSRRSVRKNRIDNDYGCCSWPPTAA